MLKRKMFFHKEPDVIPILFLLLSALLLITLFHFGWFASFSFVFRIWDTDSLAQIGMWDNSIRLSKSHRIAVLLHRRSALNYHAADF